MNQKVIIDEVSRSLIIQTEVSQTDLTASYDKKEFMKRIHFEIASKIADQVYKQIAPVIDEAMKDLKFTE